MTSLTGGPLNWLNGRAKISASHNSVHVRSLFIYHQPKSAAELVSLISSHSLRSCECGNVSRGTLEQFGVWLFDAQQAHWGEERFTLKECSTWIYHLFVTQVFKGVNKEAEACQRLQETLGASLSVEFATPYVDEELRVDLIVYQMRRLICGIQVKPSSYTYVRESVQRFNERRNARFPATVFYLLYDSNDGGLLNIDDVAKQIRAAVDRR
jgi:hypothetical protein